MTPERWQHIEEIFQTALDLAPGERERFITNACTGDAELQREVETLLTQYEQAGDFIDEPLYDQTGVQALASLINDEGDPMLGRLVGAYKIEREIGRGGMGAVYLATRADNVFQKKVAIKVVKRGMDTDFILRRFRRERQIVASLDHVNIARLLDGGATEDGRPYFVMEYIEGEPLYQYCDSRLLSLRERLRIFAQVCEAVEYAHHNQVIHRDIKPSNILVNSAGTPKLFDFGIAKLLNPEMSADTAPQTATAMRLMTVEYASPEQVQGMPVTLLSDLYSLGVLLYELLTGHRPYRFRSRLLHEMARVISEEEPEYPSVAVNRSESLLPVAHVDQEAMTIGHLCEMRSETPDSLRRELAGSLDNITLKALRKDPAQRYQSAAALRDDIVRYLEGKPVSAPLYLPPSASRHTHAARPVKKTDEMSIAILPFKLIGSTHSGETDDEYLGVGLADAIITRLSNVQRLVVRPTSSVLQYNKTGEPLEAGRNLDVDYIVDGNIRRVGETLRVTVQLLSVRDEAARWAGKFDEKLTDVLVLEDLISEQVAVALVPQLTGEEQERLAKRGTNKPEAFEAYLRGRFHWNSPTEDNIAKSIAFYQRAVELDPNYALAYAGIADYYNMLGVYGVLPFAEAAPKAREAALKAVELDPMLAAAYSALGFAVLTHDFDWQKAEEHLQRAVALNPNYSTGRLWYGYFFALAGRPEEALPHARRAIELDPYTPMIQQTANWVFYLLRLYDETIEAASRIATNDPQYGLSYVILCLAFSQLGRHEEAIEAALKATELMGRSPYTLTRLASAYAAGGQREPALQLLEEVKRMEATRYVSPHLLAPIYVHLKDYERALSELERALEIHDARVIWLGVDPQFDALRRERRFHELLRRTNNPAPQPHLEKPSTGESASGRRFSSERVTGEPRTGQKSIAVLPFKMIGAKTSGDTDDEYLGVGLADALITRLSNVRRFIVRPTSSVLQYAEKGDPLHAGHELDVDYIVDGNIRRVGEKLRVSAQLFSASDGATRWSERFDEKFTDVLELEDTLSSQIAGVLIPQLTGEEQEQLAKRSTDNAQAFEAYLRGRYHWHSLTEEGFAKSIAYYHRAIELDPNYALAYAGIADYYIFLGIYCIMPFAESSLAAKQAAQKAVELDDTLPEAHASLAFALVSHDLNWHAAEVHYKRAIELNPNSVIAHNWYSFVLLQEARFEESLTEITRAVELDPITPVVRQSLAWCHYHSRRFDEAVSVHRKIIESEPRFAWGRVTFSWALMCAGLLDEAVEQAEKAVELGSDNLLYLTALGAIYAAAGRTDEAHKVLAQLQEAGRTRYVSPYFLAMIYCHLGDKEQALSHLDQALTINDTWTTWLVVDPQWDALRTDTRFDELLWRTRNPALARQAAAQQVSTKIDVVKDKDGSEKSIAVLPFKLMNVLADGNTDDKYLSIGLADALITRLSNVRRINVRPTSSVAHFSEDDANPLDAGRLLNVTHVLDGRIQRAADRIRITVQLISIKNNKPVWAGQFQEQFTDVLSIQDTISEQVAQVLVPQLTGDERKKLAKRGTDDAAAFESYMRGRYYWNTFTVEGFAKALVCYNRAVAYAPDYALAYTGIADYYTFLGVYSVLPFSETSAAAKEAALKAVELDDESAEAYSALGIATLLHDFDWQTTERHLRRAVELNPNYAIGRTWYCYFLGMTGRFDEGFAQVRRALEIDPLTPIIHHTLNWTYYYARQYEESIASTRKLILNEPQYGLAHIFLCMVLWQTGQYREAIESGQRGIELIGRSPYTLCFLASAHAAAGEREQAQRLLAEIHEMSATRYVSPYLLAMAYSNLGDKERALAELERAWAIRDGRLAWLGVDPQFDSLRDDARYNALLHQTNNPLASKPVTTGELSTAEKVLEKSIAVLPFKLLGARRGDDTGDEYLGIGLADALITRLSNVRRFIVRPTSSVLRYGDSSDPLPAGQELGVDYVVDGNIRRAGERIRITAQLLSISEGATRWAGRFDEKFTDVLELEDSISEQVAEALVPQLTGEERKKLAKRGTDKPEAFESYLRGRYHWNTFTEEGFAKSLLCYQRAIALDPNYAAAYTGIADYFNWLGVYAVLPFHECAAAAKEAAEKAIELDDTLAEAYTALGFAVLCHDFDWKKGEALLRRAIQLNPNYATGYIWLSFQLTMQKNFDEARAAARRAVELDPLSPINRYTVGWTYYQEHRFEEAIAEYRKVIAAEPGYGMGHFGLSWALGQTGQHEEAIREATTAVEILGRSPFYLSVLAEAYAGAGKETEAREVLRQIKEQSEIRYVSPYHLAVVHCQLGEFEETFKLLEEALAITDGWLVWLGTEPQLEPVRQDPRFQEIMKRINHPAAV